VNAVVAHGTADAIAARLKQHLDAGADHVPVQVLTSPEKLVPALTELAARWLVLRSRPVHPQVRAR
jgi:2-methylisocitrate lyase-like PEP mutase family enzyme